MVGTRFIAPSYCRHPDCEGKLIAYYRRVDLSAHEKRHAKWPCTQAGCGKTLDTPRKHKQHIINHHNPQKCTELTDDGTECETVCSNPTNLKAHIDTIHRGVRITCNDCGKTYASKINRHKCVDKDGNVLNVQRTLTYNAHHAANKAAIAARKKDHPCVTCEEVFDTEKDLLLHTCKDVEQPVSDDISSKPTAKSLLASGKKVWFRQEILAGEDELDIDKYILVCASKHMLWHC